MAYSLDHQGGEEISRHRSERTAVRAARLFHRDNPDRVVVVHYINPETKRGYPILTVGRFGELYHGGCQ